MESNSSIHIIFDPFEQFIYLGLLITMYTAGYHLPKPQSDGIMKHSTGLAY